MSRDTVDAMEASVRARYSGAAVEVEPELCCPVDYDPRYPNFRSWTTKTMRNPLFSGVDSQKLALQISGSFWDAQPLRKFQAQVLEQDRLCLVRPHHTP